MTDCNQTSFSVLNPAIQHWVQGTKLHEAGHSVPVVTAVMEDETHLCCFGC